MGAVPSRERRGWPSAVPWIVPLTGFLLLDRYKGRGFQEPVRTSVLRWGEVAVSFLSENFASNAGGERGIRTLEAVLAPTRFPIVLLQPLGHLSTASYSSSRRSFRCMHGDQCIRSVLTHWEGIIALTSPCCPSLFLGTHPEGSRPKTAGGTVQS